ncbi:hypothetical protein MHU86_17006 [Fragilaria crotonensis]|nr:hypothetical protein MHU86_17006 [Fragilaria crotonensis]
MGKGHFTIFLLCITLFWVVVRNSDRSRITIYFQDESRVVPSVHLKRLEKMSNKEMSGKDQRKGLSRRRSNAAKKDTWDIPEFDECEAPKRDADVSAHNRSRRMELRNQEGSASLLDGDSKRANPITTSEVVEGANDENAAAGCKRRRSFCSFHYRTTQGGSSSVEPGDDPAMQSPGTSTKALKLLEFVHDEEVSPLDMPSMDK